MHHNKSAQRCSTPCKLASCEACTATPGCGWCAERHECMQGGDEGPCNADECSAALWMPRSCSASGVACGMFSACADCPLNEDCGWCGADARCVSDAERMSTCSGPEGQGWGQAQYVRAPNMCDAGLAVSAPSTG